MEETTKGMFFNYLIELVVKEQGRAEADAMCEGLGLPTKYSPLRSYPIQDEVQLQLAVIRRLFPDKSVEEGMRLLGRTAFDTFAGSMLGRVGLTLLANEPKKLASRVPTFIEAVDKFGVVTLEELGEREVRIDYKDFKEYDAHHQGLLQCGIEHTGVKGTVELEVHRFEERGPGDIVTDFTLTLVWD